jgi:hypothetical protein
MVSLCIPLDKWVEKLRNNKVLQIACGFMGKLPGVASYYDFINRLVKLNEKPRTKHKKRKPSKKHGKGKKMPPKHPGITKRAVAVQPSIDLELLPRTLSILGDGTCMKTGASPYGVKTCECSKNGVYRCDCPRRFSDPNATWGWDSHNERYFYGYTGYFISTYNRAEKLDLPLYLRLAQANRHDSISALVALAEFRDLYPNLKVKNFISDSASDNYPTYELLDKWGWGAVIALNPTNSGNQLSPLPVTTDGFGIPICPAGHRMVNWGLCGKDRCRRKWRCPLACGRPIKNCKFCSETDYGRTVYTKPEWDLRLFTRIPRSTRQWKNIMKERTAAERVNNRILNHYGVGSTKARGKKRMSFLTTIAGLNIHLDAQLAKLETKGLFDFAIMFMVKSAA